MKANISVDDIEIYDSTTKNDLTDVCDTSYPAGSVAANIRTILSTAIMGGAECPIQKVQTILIF